MLNRMLLKKLRKQKRLSLKDMAERTGYESINGFWRIEVGLTNPSIARVELIARTLEVSVEDLLMDDSNLEAPNGGVSR